MYSGSVKEQARMAYLKTISSIVASAGGLALFLILASTLWISQPMGSTVREYFYVADNSRKVDIVSTPDERDSSISTLNDSVSGYKSQHDEAGSITAHGVDGQHNVVDKEQTSNSQDKEEYPTSRQEDSKNMMDESPHFNVTQGVDGQQNVVDKEQTSNSTDKEEFPTSRQEDSKTMMDESPHFNVTQGVDGQQNLVDKEHTSNSPDKEEFPISRQENSKNMMDESPHFNVRQGVDGQQNVVDKEKTSNSLDKEGFPASRQEDSKNMMDESPHFNVTQQDTRNKSSAPLISADGDENATFNNKQTEAGDAIPSSATVTNRSQLDVGDSECDLYIGKWIFDSTGPLYSNNSCPIITQMQNCQGNGRPDKDYENWRWKPSQCDLPRFDANKFLELMRGKTLAFIGDSVARNQMESLLCILFQAEVPKNRSNKRFKRYYFRSTSTMIVRIWSSWLVHQTPDPFDFAPAGVAKVHLDKPDEVFMQYIKDFNVIVLSSGHWFAKQSVYILNNEIVGGQLWWPDNSRQKKIDNIEAFGLSVETIITALVTHPNYTGLTIVRSFSPDHYEGGAWNTGGSCTGKVRPALDTELVEDGFTNIMHEKQVTGFNHGIKKKSNKSKTKLMDITKAFSYRHDGHPGPYRSPDPNKITQRGPHGRPPPQDCLHWCMPGPVDTWNELIFEIIRGEFVGGQNVAS